MCLQYLLAPDEFGKSEPQGRRFPRDWKEQKYSPCFPAVRLGGCGFGSPRGQIEHRPHITMCRSVWRDVSRRQAEIIERLANSCGNASWLLAVQVISEAWSSGSCSSAVTTRWCMTIFRMGIAPRCRRECN